LNLGARIESISALGELEIQFNATIDLIANLSHINYTIMEMYIIPTPGFEEEGDEVIVEVSNNFTWNATNIED